MLNYEVKTKSLHFSPSTFFSLLLFTIITPPLLILVHGFLDFDLAFCFPAFDPLWLTLSVT